MKATCPKCGHDFNVELVADVAASSRMSLVLTPAEGSMLQAKTVGGCVEELDKLLGAVGKEAGVKTCVLVERAQTQADGSLRFDILITRAVKP